MADKKNQKWYYVGATVIICALVACYFGQPMRFMENQLGMECVSCGGGNQSLDTAYNPFNGDCNSVWAQTVIDDCCEKIYVPTCASDLAGRCGGTCPIPLSWEAAGWTSSCESQYEYYTAGEGPSANLITAYDLCQCEYYPPGGAPPMYDYPV